MEFRVLGPLEVRTGADPIRLSPKLRDLTAVLLSKPGEVVSVDRIIESIWGDMPPRSAERTLRGYVHHLRRAFGEESRIVHHAPGYLLALRDGELDAGIFEALVRRGKEADSDGRPDDASRLLHRALGLWRGPAFASHGELPHVRDEAVRLDELRLVAIEERMAADLALGRHAELISELHAIVAANPFLERPRGQLMTALYRTGRSADALEVYRDGRAVLADELGLEPGPELRALEHAILAQDPVLDLPGQAAVRPAVPGGLPPGLRTFTGREKELEQIRALLADGEDSGRGGPVIVAISGAGGIGKSTLAVHVARQVADAFPDGHLYVNLRVATPRVAPLTPAAALARFMRAMGVADGAVPAETGEAAARFRTMTADRRMLIVLDDAADPVQVRDLLPGGSGCAVLITSRRVLATLDNVAHVHLGALPEKAAITMLARLASRSRVTAEPAAASQIVRWCEYLPLAIRIAGARLSARRDLSLSALSRRLATPQSRLDELEYADLSMRTSFGTGLGSLGDDDAGRDAAGLFALAGLLDVPDFSAGACAALLDGPLRRAEAALDRLVDARLIEVPAPGRYRMQDLVRQYAREQATRHVPGSVQEVALSRASRWYLAAA